MERIVDEIEGELRRRSGGEVTTQEIGERALRHLKRLDRVAYIRFASVYRQFDDIDEFQHELARLEEASDGPLPGEQPLPGIDEDDGQPDGAVTTVDETITTGPLERS